MTHDGEEKTESFRMRMTPDEHAMLVELAKAQHMPAAHVVRTMIRREHARTVGGANRRKAKR
jgi:hypothetical protein